VIVATTADHTLPTSQGGDFWNPENLRASCTPCAQHGGHVKAENRDFRKTIAMLEQLVEQQGLMIAELLDALAAYENANERSRTKATPRIY
jgi:hypothetical protein